MPHAVVIPTSPAAGPLPFTTLAEIRELGAALAVAEDVPCTVWPATGRNGGQGRSYDHTGEAHRAYAEQLAVANRHLLVAGVSYAIVSAVPHDMGFPHVALTLREVRPGGGG